MSRLSYLRRRVHALPRQVEEQGSGWFVSSDDLDSFRAEKVRWVVPCAIAIARWNTSKQTQLNRTPGLSGDDFAVRYYQESIDIYRDSQLSEGWKSKDDHVRIDADAKRKNIV